MAEIKKLVPPADTHSRGILECVLGQAGLDTAQARIAGREYFSVSRFWFWLPGIGPIRVSTVVAAVALLVVISIKRRDPTLGLVTTLAWASTFEILSNAVGTIGFGWAVHDFVWMSAALTGWVILAGVLGVWPDLRVPVAFVMTLAAWVATGYEPNPPRKSNFNVLSEILNEASKTLLALAYLLGALRAPRSLKWNDLAKWQPWH